jgi:alginate O-acetyltransferase complex protein AlgI
MVFSSIVFLIYFLPICLLLYYIAPPKFRNAVLLIMSIFFYAWGAPRFIFVILTTTLLDFFLVNAMDKSNNALKRHLLLGCSLAVNLGLLFYFKYSNFFIENVNTIFQQFGVKHIEWVKLALPIGISFYTFETITYIVDVYRREHKPLTNFWDYQLYIIFFPKLIAGPITRYCEISDQITNRAANENIDYCLSGFYRFIIGLSKKVLIANVMAAQADAIINNGMPINTYLAWMGAIAYTMQIYFDFSGYSDMAIGLAKMFGFRLPENFNSPYIAQNITEFWRRWHITLGSWMRNYLYIPLGGNRVSSSGRLYANLWLVFIASGLWHGASWNYVIWGAYHGCFLIMDRLFLNKIYSFVGKYLSVAITFFWIIVGWVIFRIENAENLKTYLKTMFSVNSTETAHLINNDFYPMLVVALVFSFFAMPNLGKQWQEKIFMSDAFSNKGHSLMMLVTMILLVLCIANITCSTFNPFIYFRF